MNRDQAIAKIKKCLALSGSANEHEAAAALRQAQALMREHDLSKTEVDLADVSEVKSRARGPACSRWDSFLARTVAEAFGCEHFSSIHVKLSPVSGWTRRESIKRLRDVVFVGVGTAPTIAAYAHDVLLRRCTAARLAHIRKQPGSCKPITKTARGDEFALGWVVAVRKVVQAFAGREEDRLLVAAYMAANHADLTDFTPRNTAVGRNVRAGDFHDGARAGSAVRLDQALPGQDGPSLLPGAFR